MMQDPAKQELNLVTHRSMESVWDRADRTAARRVSASRILLAAAGGALAIHGMRRHSRLIAGAGAGLVAWAIGGTPDVPAAGRYVRQLLQQGGEDQVFGASEDSFPASDAPSWTPTVGTGLRRELENR